MYRRFIHLGTLLVALSGLASAQAFLSAGFEGVPAFSSASSPLVVTPPPAPDLTAPVTMPRMAPELALQVYRGRALIQAQRLAAYSAVTTIRAELPETGQSGEYELERHYSAPRSLQFTALRYTGDGFVKGNVIIRLLQSEVEHVKQADDSSTAISNANYKFSYKGTAEINGRVAHIFQLKPRKKRVGLFKGRIYVDAYTGSLVRAEGSFVKSPSFFVKKIDFVQDYADIGDFTFPIHVHSDARARIIGRTVVDIYHRDYRPVPAVLQAARQVAVASPSATE
jgi:hypothetical protein